MSYPQPSADEYAVKRYGYFRLNTRLTSPGDIYESPQGAHAFALGPESDISKVNMAYFDDQISTFVQSTSIGRDRSFVGNVGARNDAQYMPAGRPGKILLWSDDLYNSQFRPPGFNDATDSFDIVVPQLDVIQYFSPPGALVPARNDKSYLIQNVAAPLVGSAYFMIPFYGRRYGMVEITNGSANPFTWAVSGVNFAISTTGAGALDQITPIRASGPLAAAANEVTRITPDAVGMFDYLLLEIERIGANPTVPSPIKVIVSDSH